MRSRTSTMLLVALLFVGSGALGACGLGPVTGSNATSHGPGTGSPTHNVPGVAAQIIRCTQVAGSPAGHEATVGLVFPPGSPLHRYGAALGVFDYLATQPPGESGAVWGTSWPAPLLNRYIELNVSSKTIPDVAEVEAFGVVVSQPARIASGSLLGLKGRSTITPLGRLYVERVSQAGDTVSVTLAVVPRLPSGYDVSGLLQATLSTGDRSVTVRHQAPAGMSQQTSSGIVAGPAIHHWARFTFRLRTDAGVPASIQVDLWGIRIPGSVLITGLAEACARSSQS